ncbi:unnamed protein product [marine sediment metagenome]|uniref:Uncharacterized protein n=1 Tax=marine sediment metagenome TaxID=412755 RepID=X1GLY6_9ZZZZ
MGAEDYGITPPLGNRVRLLSVDVWLQSVAPGGFIEAFMKIQAGTGTRLSADIVNMEWASVMDDTMLFKMGMILFCCEQHYRFDMDKLYVGESQRFGIYSANNSNTKYSILGAFQ